jgi:hypothetical protein
MSLVNQSIIKHEMGLLNLAEELSNVSQACRVMGVSRDTFYRVKEAKETGGLEALLYKDRRRANPKNRFWELLKKPFWRLHCRIWRPGRFGCQTIFASRAFR